MELITKNALKAEDFKDKVVFWDLDGVLAPYRFNGHIMHADIQRNATDEEVDAGVFINRKPCKHVQNIMSSIDAKMQICITQHILEEEAMDKIGWIAKNCPKIDQTILNCMEDKRAIVLEKFCRDNGINKEDVIIVDDDLGHLTETEAAGFESWHVSSLMDFYED